MKSEAKTAAIMGGIVVAIVAVIGIYLTSLDAQPQNTFSAGVIDKSGLKMAPQLKGVSGYINSDQSLAETLKGKVVLYDIWTYSCINCQRTIPFLTAWDEKYSDKGLVIIGIHTPEFEFEKDINNVKLAVEKFGIEYPVILDNDKVMWNLFENRYWPRKYIADAEGYIRYNHIGEGAYNETEKVIQALLNERAESMGLNLDVSQSLVDLKEFEHETRTPELYFGYGFAYGRKQIGNAEGFQPGKEITYSIPDRLHDNNFYLDGKWRNLEDRMILTSDTGRIILPYFAKQVNIVAAGEGTLTILIDGKIIDSAIAGSDVTDGIVHISKPTLYNLVNSEYASSKTIEIQVDGPGFEIYTFTFG
jgi:thiol-disulfide isomerase/thioredoxin